MTAKGKRYLDELTALLAKLDGDRTVGDEEYVEIMDQIEEQAGASARAKQEEIRNAEREMDRDADAEEE